MEYAPIIAKLKIKLQRQTETVIETSQHIEALEKLVQGKLATSPNPIKTDSRSKTIEAFEKLVQGKLGTSPNPIKSDSRSKT